MIPNPGNIGTVIDRSPVVLCIFLMSGKTFTFKWADIITNNESTLVFNYQAMSDQKLKTATFNKNQIAGYSECLG
jgi:hypothetical protein